MSRDTEDEYWVPECVKGYLRACGFSTRVLEDMEPYVREWDSWMRAVGEFYDYRGTDDFGRVYQVHRRSIMPAMRVCREWGSLLLDEKTTVACDSQECTDWLGSFFSSTNFWGRAYETVVRAFAVWMDVGRRVVMVRHYDARMVVPLSWDSEGIRECAFVTRAYRNGESVDQLQMCLFGDDGVYRIRSVCFDKGGRMVSVPGVADEVVTGNLGPTFDIVRPSVPNTRVDFSPCRQSVFADAIDAVQSVDLAYDALINEIDTGKMRVFLSDAMFDQQKDSNGKRVPIPVREGRLHRLQKGHEHRGHHYRVRTGAAYRGAGKGVRAGPAGFLAISSGSA